MVIRFDTLGPLLELMDICWSSQFTLDHALLCLRVTLGQGGGRGVVTVFSINHQFSDRKTDIMPEKINFRNNNF